MTSNGQIEIFEDIGMKECYTDSYFDHEDESEDEVAPSELDNHRIDFTHSQEKFKLASLLKPASVWEGNESLSERIGRISQELRQIEVDLDADKDFQTDLQQFSHQISELGVKTHGLQKRLHDRASSLVPKDHTISALERDIQIFRESGITKCGVVQPAPEDNLLIYKLQLGAANHQIVSKDAKIQELEKRLTNLERLVGLHTIDPISNLKIENQQSIFATSGTLVGAMQRVDHHLAMLSNPVTFEGAVRRIKDSINSLDRLAELKRKQKLDLRNSSLDAGSGKVNSFLITR